MSEFLHLQGPAVTLFGDRDELDDALGAELARRGCSMHVVTTTMGWLSTTTHAVIRVGTQPGDRAMDGLAASQVPGPHVVAVCETDPAASQAAQVQSVLEHSPSQHVASLVCHGPLDLQISAVNDLAATIADAILRSRRLAAS